MKKTISFFLTLILSTLCIQYVFATEIQVNILVDNETGVVSIIGSGARGDKEITVQVIDPEGNIDYIDQTISNSNGNFIFQYKITGSYGEYTAKIGGSEFDSIKTVYFEYSKPLIPIATDIEVISSIDETGIINIIGKGAEANKAITVKVICPDGDFDYIDQTVSNNNGEFSFQYKTTGPYGEYTVKIGGSGVDSVIT
ncbi:hypothetical protein EDC18_1161, partial [Natranaerovirga pectinivora]